MAKEVASTDPGLRVREKQPVAQEGMRPGLVFQPDVDILERKDAYLIYADLPGVDEQNVHVRLDKGVLSLEAHLATAPDPSWTPIHAEYHLGSYYREFRVSDEIDAEGVAASMRDGVLELRLPKSAKHQARRIEVHAA